MRVRTGERTSAPQRSVALERSRASEDFDSAEGILRGSLIGLLLWLVVALVVSPYFAGIP